MAVLEGRLERAAQRAARLAAERDAARRAKPAAAVKVVRERVVDQVGGSEKKRLRNLDAAVARAQRRAVAAAAKSEAVVQESREQIAVARMDAAEARQAAQRLAARLERAEATIATLRAELKAERDRAADRLVALERRLDVALAEPGRKPEVVTVLEEAPDAAEVRAAQAAAARAEAIATDAEVRAARAERELRETVAAIRGEARRLTAAELAELRVKGPSGPVVMAAALKALAAARATNNPTRMRDALRRVAQAAVTWGERSRWVRSPRRPARIGPDQRCPAMTRDYEQRHIADFLRDDAGTPLGSGMPSGSPLRADGQSHYEAWLALVRRTRARTAPSAPARPGGTVDHVDPRSRQARGLGTAHGWQNTVGACRALQRRQARPRPARVPLPPPLVGPAAPLRRGAAARPGGAYAGLRQTNRCPRASPSRPSSRTASVTPG